MFPLFQKELPRNAQELAAALSTSLRRALNISRDPVVVREKSYPDLEEIAIDLTGATIRIDAPRPAPSDGKGEPAITAQRLSVIAQPVSAHGAAIDLALEADGIVLHQNRDADDNVVLLLHRAASGRVGVSIAHQDLETLIAELAKAESGRHGVVIEDVLLNLTSRNPRSLGAELRLQARKLFLRTTIRISGQLEIDDQLVAHISGLGCNGESTLGVLACGILAPHLQKLQARPFPLLTLSLGEIKLRDIKLQTDDGIRVTAEFGTDTTQEPA
jgi:hypothetical protein